MHIKTNRNYHKILIFKILNFIWVSHVKTEIRNQNYQYSFVDKRYETLILPINGTPTPFHISTIKVY